MTSKLEAELSHHLYLKEQLRLEFPGEDDEAFTDSLEGLTDLNEMILQVLRSTDDDHMLIDGIGKRMVELHDRSKRLEARADFKRHLIATVMERASLKKITAPDATISLVHRPGGLIITDPTLIPEAYKAVPEPRAAQPDRKAIKEALDKGLAVPGAVMGNGSVGLMVRVR